MMKNSVFAVLLILITAFSLTAAPFQSDYIITSEFGSMDGKGGERRPSGHTGIDLIPTEWPFLIYPILPGVIESIGIDEILGKFVIIRHSETVQTLYAHGETIYNTAIPGETATTHTPIMKMGDTGFTDGPHLHLQVMVNGVPVNPKEYLK